MKLSKRALAEFIGTFWLVFGGCGSAIFSAAFPQLGIGFYGVAFAFGLTVLTMAYAIGRLNAADFSKVSAAVPGMGKFLRAAPEAGSTSTITSLNSVVGGQAGGLASLAGSFQSLGLSPSMVGKFVPVLQN